MPLGSTFASCSEHVRREWSSECHLRALTKIWDILHVMHLYNELKANPQMDFYPRTFVFGAKAAAGYKIAKLTIKLINSVADVVNNDPDIDGRIKVVFIENYRVSNAEIIFAASEVILEPPKIKSDTAQSCPPLCYPMDCSMPGFPVLYHPLEFAQTHAH